MNRKKLLDIAERVGWTAAQAGLSIITVDTFDLPAVYVPLFAAVLSAVKGWVATRMGDGTAATLPKGS